MVGYSRAQLWQLHPVDRFFLGPYPHSRTRITLDSYDPNVICLEPEGRPPINCQSVLEDFPSGKSAYHWYAYGYSPIFGQFYHEVPELFIDGRFRYCPTPEVYSVKSYNVASLDCMLLLDATHPHGGPAIERELWEAAVAIDAMCIRHGRTGWAPDLGKVSPLASTVG